MYGPRLLNLTFLSPYTKWAVARGYQKIDDTWESEVMKARFFAVRRVKHESGEEGARTNPLALD